MMKQTMRIYFDGNQIGDISTQTGTIKASGRPLRIGNYANPGLDCRGPEV